MVEEQALKLTVLWQQTNDLLSQMQEAAPDNAFIQEIKAIREKLDGVVNRAVDGNGDGRTREEEGPGGHPRGPWL